MDAPRAHGDAARSEVQTDPDASVEAARPDGERARLPVTRLLFLGALTVMAVAYTVIAFDMEWRIPERADRPGFLPADRRGAHRHWPTRGDRARAARSFRGPPRPPQPSDADEEAELGIDGDGRTDAPVTAFMVGAMWLCYVLFEPLGALLASILFLALVLQRGQPRPPSAERAGEQPPRPCWLVPALRGAPRLGVAARPCSTTTVNPFGPANRPTPGGLLRGCF